MCANILRRMSRILLSRGAANGRSEATQHAVGQFRRPLHKPDHGGDTELPA
jgi:hypothetical protein